MVSKIQYNSANRIAHDVFIHSQTYLNVRVVTRLKTLLAEALISDKVGSERPKNLIFGTVLLTISKKEDSKHT